MDGYKVAAGSLFFAVLFFLVSACCLYAPDQRVSRGALADHYTDYLDTRIPKLMKRYRIPGASVALVTDGRLIWSRAYGHADVKTGRAMAVDMPMRVQSISKPVTAWAIMKLEAEGVIDIDRPVEQYLKSWAFPPSAYAADRITTRQLLSHTAGMPLGDVFAMYAPGEPMPSLNESLTRTAVPVQQAGSGFLYSNVGYNLLELLIEEVTGRDFSEYMKDEILLPLGMEHSSFLLSDEMASELPDGYALSGRAVPPYVYPEKASGGLLASAEDIAAFAMAGMPSFSQQDVLPDSSVWRLYETQAEKPGIYRLVFDAYGFGYYTERLLDKTAVSHGGQGAGWMSHFHAVPQTGDAIVIITNSQRAWPFIACLLNGWARWRGFSSPGMTRILAGECGVWALAGLVFSIALSQLAKIALSAAAGGFTPTFPRFDRADLPRMTRLGGSLVILAGLFWCACQQYLFVSSVFPSASAWLGIAAAVFSGALLLRSVLPK